MSRRARLALFLAGAAVFAYMLRRIGVTPLLADAARTGSMIVPIVLLYGVVHACETQAWQRVLADEPRRPSFARLYAIVVAGSALNFVTPLANVGGEPYRIAAVAPWLGPHRAAGAVILHAMLRTLGLFLVWLTALALALALLRHSAPAVVVLSAAMVAVAALAALLVAGHRAGVLARALDVLHRVPLLRRAADVLETRRPALVAVDRQITEFYHRRPGRFGQALALQYLSRCVYMVEICLIGASIGVHIGYFQAFAIGGLEALAVNVLFLVPFGLGAREGTMYVLFGLFGFDPRIGIYTALVSRLRDLLWIGAGLALIWAGGGGRRRAAAPASQPAADVAP